MRGSEWRAWCIIVADQFNVILIYCRFLITAEWVCPGKFITNSSRRRTKRTKEYQGFCFMIYERRLRMSHKRHFNYTFKDISRSFWIERESPWKDQSPVDANVQRYSPGFWRWWWSPVDKRFNTFIPNPSFLLAHSKVTFIFGGNGMTPWKKRMKYLWRRRGFPRVREGDSSGE